MEIKLNEHIVEIEGKEYIPYDIALKDHVTIKEEQLKNKTDWWKKMRDEKN